jgi:hypothetical protein
MSSVQIATIIACIFTTAFLDWLLMKWLQKKQIKLLDYAMKRIQSMNFSKLFANFPAWTKSRNFELILIALWAIWVGRAYLNFDPLAIPGGREYSTSIQYHHTWTRMLECGWCAIWNGTEAGGYPMTGVIGSSTFHPLVALTTLLFGVAAGAKITLVISLWLAGLAQWWLAYELKLGKIARLWSAGIAIAAGNMTGEMQGGFFPAVLTMAMISLVFAGIIAVYREKGKIFIVLLGLLGALTIVAGSGYLAMGLIGVSPSLLVFVLSQNGKNKKIWWNYLLALLLACLFAAPILVSVLHFIPNFQKGASASFETAQSIKYMPLNLVIDDWNYYMSEGILNKGPFPALYIIFIGWIPVILAVIGIFKNKQEDRPIVWYMALTILQVFLLASATSLKWIVSFLPMVANLRFSSTISGLSVPLVLGFSAYGIEYLTSMEWPRVDVGYQTSKIGFSIKWLLIIPMIVISLNSVYQFSKASVYTIPQELETIPVLSELKTADSQWVSPPVGDHFFSEPAIAMGLKLSPGNVYWTWAGRQPPEPRIAASRSGPPSEYFQKLVTPTALEIFKNPGNFYASVITDGSTIPCTAYGTGGLIKVYCNTDADGTLIVKENYFSGWRVKMQDQPAALIVKDNWLAVEAPAGSHDFTFQYLPWDVPFGIVLSVIGWILSFMIWKSSDKSASTAQAE